MIPKIIHIITNKEDEIMVFKKRYEKYLKITFMIWDNQLIIPLLEKYPKIYSVFKNVDKFSGFIHSISIQKLLSSFVILKDYGGIYLEIDLNCFQWIDKIFSQKESDLIYLIKSSPSSFFEKITNLFYSPFPNQYPLLAMKKQHPIWELVFPIIENSNTKYTIQHALSNVIKDKNFPVNILDCDNGTLTFFQTKPTYSFFWLQIILFISVIIIIIMVERINRFNVIKFNLSSYIPGITHPIPASSSAPMNHNLPLPRIKKKNKK